MNIEEFLTKDEPKNTPTTDETPETETNVSETVAETIEEPIEEPMETAVQLDVQKAVVEELAADKAAQDEQIVHFKSELAHLTREVSELTAEKASMKTECDALKAKVAELDSRLAEALNKEFDAQERNPNALALLDRDVELPDRFPGESRDHVLEALKEARDRAEQDGRLRRAQVLESVLVANEPNGTLAKRRAELEKVFKDNGNIVSGPVIEALKNMGLSHKNGEEYLLPSEIIKRNF